MTNVLLVCPVRHYIVLVFVQYIFCSVTSSGLPPCGFAENNIVVSRSCLGYRCCIERRQRCQERALHCRLHSLPLEMQLSFAQTAVDTLSGWTAGQDVWEQRRGIKRERDTRSRNRGREKIDGHKKKIKIGRECGTVKEEEGKVDRGGKK